MNEKFDALEIFIRKLMIKWTFRKRPCWRCKFFNGFYLDGYTFDCERHGDNQKWDFVAPDWCDDFVSQRCNHDWDYTLPNMGGVDQRKCKKCGVVHIYDRGSAMYRVLGWTEVNDD